ncbi:MAG TPA: hypothetical protein VEU29_03340 [Actinomycetota bacterium]|nr:hypothetical protein [Actinomycetota bacterium]
MTPWRVGAIACALVSLAGCSPQATNVDDLAGLATAVSEQGVRCDAVDPAQGTDLVKEIGACEGSDVTLYVFESAEALDDWEKVGPLVTPAAVGANWAVTGEPSAIERIADGLGGEMVPAE